jgi:hypothetical protein
MVLTISEHGGPVQAAGTVREESPPIKAGHLETTCSRFKTSTRRRASSSAGLGRSQQLEILPSLNSKEFFSGLPPFPAEFSLDARFLPSAEFSLDARFLPSAKFLLDDNISVYIFAFLLSMHQ